ncbi:sensor domain-containing diguanylate cyclase [Janthinobacterium sp. 17J80-10]|uniref:sensor domain-containing protein n=1 Tax=Janthinobacterium sp. 17J80-10 TaxID=2497863 RepID=UPI0019D6D1DC|nr:sensor domain-containing diguanylate cyclase [Janthinobacterium sp. 17J80-10]
MLDVVCVVDCDGHFVAVSAACEKVFGYTQEEMIGKPMIDLVLPADRERTLVAASGVMAGNPLRNFENRYVRKDGQVVDIMWSASWSEGDQLRLAVARDITLYKQASARLRYLAQYDALTGLPNRALFEDRLQVALTRDARNGQHLALLFIDLDDFKPVNDQFGHAVGDLLLQQVAARIHGCVRESDTVSRIGGDEFVVLLDVIHSLQNAEKLAEEICVAIRAPLVVASHTVQVSASIGIALHRQHGTDPVQLMRSADIAMYAAKHAGGNQCRSAVHESFT